MKFSDYRKLAESERKIKDVDSIDFDTSRDGMYDLAQKIAPLLVKVSYVELKNPNQEDLINEIDDLVEDFSLQLSKAMSSANVKKIIKELEDKGIIKLD